MSKHTKGPWHVSTSGRYVRHVQSDGTSPNICEVHESFGGPEEEEQANACLIAGAPELLDVVIAYRLHHKLMLNITGDSGCPCQICQLAEAALLKVGS